MSGVLKVVVIVLAAAVVLVLAIAGGGYVWWQYNKDELLTGGQAAMAEGKAFGKTTDNNGCLTEALARVKKTSGITDAVKVRLFLSSCLDESQPVAEFCDGVPSESDMLKNVQWRLQKADQMGLTDAAEKSLLDEIVKYCNRKSGRARGNPAEKSQ